MSDQTTTTTAAASEYNELSRRQFVAGSARRLRRPPRSSPIFPAWLPQGRRWRSRRTPRATSSSRSSCAAAPTACRSCVPFVDAELLHGPARRSRFRAPTAAAAEPRHRARQQLRVPAGDERPDAGVSAPASCSSCTRPARSIRRARTSTRSASWKSASRATRTSRPAGSAGTWPPSPPMRTDAPLRALGFSSGLAKTLVGAPQTLADSGSGELRDRRRREHAHASARLAARRLTPTGAEPVRSAALDALNTIELLRLITSPATCRRPGAVYPNTGFGTGLRSTAALIKADIGVEAIQVDLGGWDTHSEPGSARRLDVHARCRTSPTRSARSTPT